MSKKFVLRYLPVAEDDLISILDWIAKDSPNRALKFIDKLEARISKLELFPFLGRIPRNSKLRNYGYLVLIIEEYFVFYILKRNVIEIHRVIRTSRDLDKII